MFTGAVLLVNGLALVGKVDPTSVAFFNIIGGLLNVGIAISTGIGDNTFGAAQLFLFGFTYLWMAYNALTKQTDWRAFGWYCAFVAAMAFPTAAMTYSDGAPWFGTFWITWGVLWYLFFLMFGLGVTFRRSTEFAGVTTILIGVATAMVPGYLLTSGAWAGG